MSIIQAIKKWRYPLGLFLMGSLIFYYYLLPKNLFADPYSSVLLDQSGQLLGARIAADGQWRFPECKSVPDKFEKSLLLFEDRHFYHHPGINPLSILRAVWQNLGAGRIVSGGSTITMQVIRLQQKNKERTFWTKLKECILATRLELKYTKKQILNLYASHAPFGGNVVGLDAACWRYFGRDHDRVTWAEAAMLAVLPNNPSLIHPGKNQQILADKRNRLLARLLEHGAIDSLTWKLALDEPLPEKPLPLPDYAPHLLNRMIKEGHGQEKVVCTIDAFLQEQVNQMVQRHQERFRTNEIWNAAALVMEVSSGKVLAYTGNAREEGSIHENEVDIIDAARSTGSILKPLLYAAMLDEGSILSQTLLPDVPTVIDGFAPQNFSNQYDGAVPADAALIRSLNVPAVHMLKEYRYERFHALLQRLGLQTLVNDPDHYGLSLILGGAEAKLWELAGIYASLGRILLRYQQTQAGERYNVSDFHLPVWRLNPPGSEQQANSKTGLLSAPAIWQTFEALTELNRPDDESGWKSFRSSQHIAWKTGTSYGLRDAWSIGVTPDYVVAVWVGNATGEGRPGLIGGEVAAPLMFDLFSHLPKSSSWFECPLNEMAEAEICTRSGYLAGAFCDDVEKRMVTTAGAQSRVCPNHCVIHLSPDEKYQVHAGCENIGHIINKNWFLLPPIQAHYYQKKNPQYRAPAPFRSDCQQGQAETTMAIIYPRERSKVYIPRQLDGSAGKVTFQLAHTQKNGRVFWHLDADYLGETSGMHHMSFNAEKGMHKLMLVDNSGFTLIHEFEILSDS